MIYKRFALLIEAYCRANYTHLNAVLRQVDMVVRLTNLSKIIKTMKDNECATKVTVRKTFQINLLCCKLLIISFITGVYVVFILSICSLLLW